MSSSLTTIAHKITLVFDALDNLNNNINEYGRTEIFRRVSKALRQSFRLKG